MKKAFTSKVLLGVALASFPSLVHAAPLTLVKGGKPNATIVVEADAARPIKAAGADLQKYIRKMTGVELPLRTDGKSVEGITLNVGKTATTTNADRPGRDLNPETYAIRQRGDSVYFTGNYPSPTAFAVYSFLQDQLGVRWFAPGDDWEYVPQTASKDLIVDVKEVVKTPDFSPRIWSGHHWVSSWSDWNLRNKTVQSERVPRRQFQNNMYRIFPQSKYGKTHPEYFPLISGKRWIPTEDSYRNWWPCMGNKDVQRITLEYAQEYFRKNPESDSFSLGMDDIYNMCGCNLCRAMDARPDDYEKKKFSNRFYTFVNIIAKELKKTHPDKYIGTLIYHIARELPEKVDKLEDNVFGYITQNSGNWYNPEVKEEDMELTRQWAKRVNHLSRYDYFGFGSFTPRVIPRLMDEEMKFDKSLGLEGMYVEVYTFLPHTAPMMWAFAQLQWDVNRNIDSLLDEFYTKMYPSTHPTMKKYFTLLEDSWMTERPGHTGVGWEHRNILRQATSISAEDTRKGLQLLEQAFAQAKTPVEKRRIDVARAGLKYASYAILEYDLAQQLATRSITNQAEAEAALRQIQEFAALIKEREPYWEAAAKRKDLVGENIRGLTNRDRPYIQSNFNLIKTPAIPGILRVLDWYHTNQPERAAQIGTDLTAKLPAGFIKDAIDATQWLAQNEKSGTPSLLKNGTFEDTGKNTGENTAKAEEDWQTEGAPVGWSSWSRMGLGKFTRAPGRKPGSHGISVSAPASGESATLLQSVSAKPGERYVATAYIKLEDPINAPDVTLSFRYRNKSGWLKDQNTTQRVRPTATPGWQKVVLAITVPQDATAFTVMLGTNAATAVFDDVMLYKLPS